MLGQRRGRVRDDLGQRLERRDAPSTRTAGATRAAATHASADEERPVPPRASLIARLRAHAPHPELQPRDREQQDEEDDRERAGPARRSGRGRSARRWRRRRAPSRAPGPPCVMMRTTSNAWKLVTRLVVATKAAVGASSGRSRDGSDAQAPAPSSAAASSSDARHALQPGEEDDHRVPGELPDADDGERRQRPARDRRAGDSGAPSARSSRPTTPELPSSIHIQSSATATQLTTYALKTLARTKREEAPRPVERAARARGRASSCRRRRARCSRACGARCGRARRGRRAPRSSRRRRSAAA